MNTPIEAEAGAGSTFSHHTVLSALRCWWKLVIPCSVLFACVAGGAMYSLHRPQYTADAWLMIREHHISIIGADVKVDSKRFIQNQMEIIRSPMLLGPLVGRPEIVSTPEFRSKPDIQLALAQMLKIKPRGQSEIYVVSFTSESPQKAELIVKEVVNAYLTYNDDLELQQNARIMKLLKEQAEDRYREMTQLRADVRRMSIDITGIDPYAPGTKPDDRFEKSSPLAGLQGEIIALQIEQDVLSAKIKAKQQQGQEPWQPTESQIEKEIGFQPSYLAQQAKIEHLEKKESEYQRAGRDPRQNPAFKQLQTEIANERQALELLKSQLHDAIQEDLTNRLRADNDAALKTLKDEFASADVRLRVLDRTLKDGMSANKQLTGDTLDLEFKRAKLEQVTKIHDAIHQRSLMIATEQKAPERVSLLKPATKPLYPDEMTPWKKMGMVAGLALLLPFGIAVAWEHFFRRVSNRSQVEAIQQLSVVGEVTSLPVRPRSSRSRSAERDVILFEESVDSLRTYLSLAEHAPKGRVIAITSAVSGEGKTSLAAQLAVCMARATKQPTLLIDGDLRSPDIHNIFDLDQGPGLAEVLQQECSLEDAIETGFSDRLHLLTAGKLNTNPHRLLGSNDFSRLLERLKTKYWHIIIDTPPILPASESLVLARAADTAILCVRRDHSRLDQSQAAYTRMQGAGVKVAGAVLNGIPARQYSYRYGHYAYGETAMLRS